MTIKCIVSPATAALIREIVENFAEYIDEAERECQEHGYSDCLIPTFEYSGDVAKYVTCSGKGRYTIVLGDEEILITFEGYRRSFLDGNLLLAFDEVPEYPEAGNYLTVIFCGEQPDGMPFEVHLGGEIVEYHTSMPEKPLK